VLDLSGRPRHQAVSLADNRDRPVAEVLAERVLGARWTEPRVEVSKLGWEAAVRGAAGSVVNRIVQNPADHMRRSA
jgi:hypothetical protein